VPSKAEARTVPGKQGNRIMNITAEAIKEWSDSRIKQGQVQKYMKKGNDFIDDDYIFQTLNACSQPDKKRVRDIIAKSLNIETLTLYETAYLINVRDKGLIQEMQDAALFIKKKVYDNRIVTFAPLYLGNFCVNDCLYCGFRKSNRESKRRVLSLDEVKKEVEVLAGEIGHKRLIVVYGEHPNNSIEYMIDSIKAIYSVKVKTRKGFAGIRRVNVNAPPLSIQELQQLHQAGIGTYQVFQETYNRKAYESVHPRSTVKGDYRWRLYSMHRAQEAGIDDIGLGVLFGLYDWRFEIMGLVAHSRALEESFGIGPHTISFPRLEPAVNAPFTSQPEHKVSDDNFKKLITIIRLAVPYTGMIITARENSKIRRDALSLGITQTDASTKIGIGAYSGRAPGQEKTQQQFALGDTRSLDEVIREFASMGYISSFCTAGYRCGRTGKCIMDLLRSGQEGKFCKLNAVLTFREWLDDFASEKTKAASEPVIQEEISQIKQQMPKAFPEFIKYYEKIKNGERDLYF
jgi:2-iminoacetate synthase